MENNSKPIISEYALEVICTRTDKINERLVKALILAIVLFFLSNAVWAYLWMQYDYSSEATDEEIVTIDSGESGNANYANHGGSVLNGENNSYHQDNAQEETDQEGQ